MNFAQIVLALRDCAGARWCAGHLLSNKRAVMVGPLLEKLELIVAAHYADRSGNGDASSRTCRGHCELAS